MKHKCKYCHQIDGHIKMLCNAHHYYPDGDDYISMGSYISKHDHLVFECEGAFGSVEPYLYLEDKIKFCPMCGRKLSEG